ncbi:hypothetical protein BGZ95_004421 [Linnemannia exigua]|uniref:Rpr2-domain-containing protein n=1 Tax=Linnemannia exigua TaxID=604196 RepID=A0AAD4DLP9_9FUNG|nr:hypothetical protein BGZ95_004421 [Linnemannia exigua]
MSQSCAACGTIFVPGVNSKVRVVPVAETRAEREKRKKVERKRAKQDKKKNMSALGTEAGQNVDMSKATITEAGLTDAGTPTATTATNKTTTTTTNQTPKSSQPLKKIIRITPHTEIAQQQQQQQNQQRMNIRHGSSAAAAATSQKIDKHANQILNHVIYSCQRCDRITELPGTKEGLLNTRVKVTKPVSQRRKFKALEKQQQEKAIATSVAVGPASTNPSTPSASSSSSRLQPPNTALSSAQSSPKLPSTPNNNTNTKRLASSHDSPSPIVAGSQDLKRTKYSVSLPASPTTGLSRATSAASSAATSPASSPRPFGLDDKRTGGGGGGSGSMGGGGNNKKKKKAGLANLLASQKPKDSDAGSGGSAGGGGDNVLANFLMGL